MMNKKKFLLIALSFIFINIETYSFSKIFIKYKIENEIITNIDIKNEARYLVALNSQLKNIDNSRLLKISEQSIIRETIKRIELEKYFTLTEENSLLNSLIENFYLRLNLKNLDEFEKYLKDQNLDIKNIRKKIAVEATWNKLIFEKYNSQVDVNIDKLKNKIDKQNTIGSDKLLNLYEIVFENDKDTTLELKLKNIIESINEIGFENTANIYSVSESAKFGGSLGWIEEKNLSQKIIISIKDLKPGQFSKAMKFGNNFLILKIENIKNQKRSINKKKELEKLISLEKNKQLEQYSKIYFNKVKINTKIDAL
jgi:peptidyl-prolyl cis-trans isomerase SurA